MLLEEQKGLVLGLNGKKGNKKSVDSDLRQQKKIKSLICFGSFFSTDSRGKCICVFLNTKYELHSGKSCPGVNSNPS